VKDHSHQWDKQPFTSLVERGACYCGAVRFFPLSGATAAIDEAKIQNEKHGKEGHRDKMANRGGQTRIDSLPPVPPRPDTSGMNHWHRNMAIKAYYEANREAILHDFDTLGELAMRKRWGISQATWGTGKETHGLRNRFRPEVYGAPLPRKKKGAAPAPPPGDRTSSSAAEEAQEESATPVVTLVLRIYVHQNSKVKVISS